MRLIDDAGILWHRLWSVRLSLVAGVASGLDAGWQAWVLGQPPYIAIITSLISFGAAGARIVAQPKLPGKDCDG